MHAVPDFGLQNVVELVGQLVSNQKARILVFHHRIEEQEILLALSGQSSIDVALVLAEGSLLDRVGLERLVVCDFAEGTGFGAAVLAHAGESTEHGVEGRLEFEEVEEVLEGSAELVVFELVVLLEVGVRGAQDEGQQKQD